MSYEHPSTWPAEVRRMRRVKREGRDLATEAETKHRQHGPEYPMGYALSKLPPQSMLFEDLIWTAEEAAENRAEADRRITRLLECIPEHYGNTLREMVATWHTPQTEVAAMMDVSQPTVSNRRLRAMVVATWAAAHWPMHTPREILKALLVAAVAPQTAWEMAWAWGRWSLSACPTGVSQGQLRHNCMRASKGLLPGGRLHVPLAVREDIIEGFGYLAEPKKTGRPMIREPAAVGFPGWLPPLETT